MIVIEDEKYYTSKETANLLNISMASLRRFRKLNILNGTFFSERKVFYKEADIKKCLTNEV
jgi:hypothetical protein